MIKNKTIAYIKANRILKTTLKNFFGNKDLYILIDDLIVVLEFLNNNKDNILNYYLEPIAVNSLMPLSDITSFKARIEPGAIIRSNVSIGNDAVILMGAIINCDVVVGEKTMVDMGAVIGSKAFIGNNCHIGAGAVIAGVLEPISEKPVVIEDDVLIGANAVILEGVHIYKGAIVGAGAVVKDDVLAYQTVAGVPAKVIKEKNNGWEFNERLR